MMGEIRFLFVFREGHSMQREREKNASKRAREHGAQEEVPTCLQHPLSSHRLSLGLKFGFALGEAGSGLGLATAVCPAWGG